MLVYEAVRVANDISIVVRATNVVAFIIRLRSTLGDIHTHTHTYTHIHAHTRAHTRTFKMSDPIYFVTGILIIWRDLLNYKLAI